MDLTFIVFQFKNDCNGVEMLDTYRRSVWHETEYCFVLDCPKASLDSIIKHNCIDQQSMYYVKDPPSYSSFNDIKNIKKTTQPQKMILVLVDGEDNHLQFGNVIKEKKVYNFNKYTFELHMSIIENTIPKQLILQDFVNEAFTMPNHDLNLFQSARIKHSILKKMCKVLGMTKIKYCNSIVFDDHYEIQYNCYDEWKKLITEIVSFQETLIPDFKSKSLQEKISILAEKLTQHNTPALSEIMVSPVCNIIKNKLIII